jgi:hypothetical protein
MTLTVRGGTTAARLTDTQLAELMQLLKGADTAELKVSIPSDSHIATIRGLPIDPVEAQPRQVFFFDTPDLTLNKAGIVVRARRIAGGRGDTVIKLRPIVPEMLPPELRKSGGLGVEVDMIPGGFVCSASMKGRITGDEVRQAVAAKLPIRKLFNRDQRDFFEQRAPAGLTLDNLVALGPTFVLKSTFTPPELGRRFVAELWLYPDGSRILELSTKCPPAESFAVAAAARVYLAGRGVSAGTGVQQTKTRAALDYYSAQFNPPPAAALKPAPKKRATSTRAATTRGTSTRRATTTRRAAASSNGATPRTGTRGATRKRSTGSSGTGSAGSGS